MQLSKIGQFMHFDNSGAGVNMHSTQFSPGENRMLSFPSNSILLTSHTDYYADIAHTLPPHGPSGGWDAYMSAAPETVEQRHMDYRFYSSHDQFSQRKLGFSLGLLMVYMSAYQIAAQQLIKN